MWFAIANCMPIKQYGRIPATCIIHEIKALLIDIVNSKLRHRSDNFAQSTSIHLFNWLRRWVGGWSSLDRINVYFLQFFCKFLIFDMSKLGQFRFWHIVWLVKKKNHTSIDTLPIDMTCTTRHMTLRWHFRKNVDVNWHSFLFYFILFI